MQWLPLSAALVLAFAIIAIGIFYIVRPRVVSLGFGLPLPEEGPNVAWWLRLKGVRDITSGLAVLAFMASGGSRDVGIILAVKTVIPIGDMLTILAAKGSTRAALGMHGVTALIMVLAAIPLILGAH